jgi:hypothetical protein
MSAMVDTDGTNNEEKSQQSDCPFAGLHGLKMTKLIINMGACGDVSHGGEWW